MGRKTAAAGPAKQAAAPGAGLGVLGRAGKAARPPVRDLDSLTASTNERIAALEKLLNSGVAQLLKLVEAQPSILEKQIHDDFKQVSDMVHECNNALGEAERVHSDDVVPMVTRVRSKVHKDAVAAFEDIRKQVAKQHQAATAAVEALAKKRKA